VGFEPTTYGSEGHKYVTNTARA